MTVSFRTPSFDAPAQVLHTPGEGTLAHRLASGATTAALTFAGQGWRWWDDLESLLDRRPWLRARASAWSQVIAEHVAEPTVRDLGGAPGGFDPLSWIGEGSAAPSAGALCSLPVSLPGALLTQLLMYREAWEDGLHAAVDAGSMVATTGHSGGLLAAAAVAACPDGLDDDAAVAGFLHLSVLIGHVAGTCQHAVPAARLDAALAGDPDARTPMVAVSGIRVDRLEALLDAEDRAAVGLALRHGPARAVLAGLPDALDRVRRRLADLADSQPGGSRLVWEPLAANAPFHHPIMSDASTEVIERAHRAGLSLAGPREDIALIDPSGPERVATAEGLVERICTTLLVRPGRWDLTAGAIATGAVGARPADWVLDLGPSDGVARLVRAAVRGTGTRVLALATPEGRRDLVTVGASADDLGEPYARYAPRAVSVRGSGARIENRFTRLTGRSPVILAGMTPTTVDAPIVAAAANAGFLAELAGGGQVTEEIFAERLVELDELLEPGQEVVFNTLHLDPYLWGLHLGRHRLVQRARAAGAPIAGVTISAGIPDVDAAVELLDELHELGLWCNAFKPGTVEQVARVVEIASAAPRHTVFVHVEGGTAGGHHSWVDLDDLLLAGYHRLRGCPNVVICVGGGIGTPERAADYLSGRWSLRHTGVEMPVDAVLIGTAAMAAREATATRGVKEALVGASGRAGTGTDAGFVSRGAVEGSVTSGRSGLDADIHFLDNRASRCAALLDEVAGDSDAVQRRRDEIVEALAGTAKPYFGDVEDMTYEQLLRRFVELTAIGGGGRYEDGRWLDHTHRARFLDLLRRAEARLHPAESGYIPTRFATPECVDDPDAAIDELVAEHPDAATARLHPADPGYFVSVCDRPGKPVPFVAVIDAEVRRRYQSDSLWQAQHPAYDAEQVLVIPGPAAVGGITRIDEPVADLLGRFEACLVEQLCAAGAPRPVLRLRRHGPTAALSGPVAALFEAPTVHTDRGTVRNPLAAFGPFEHWDARVADGHLDRASITLAGPDGRDETVTVRAEGDRVVLRIDTPRLARYGAGATSDASAGESFELVFHHEHGPGADVVVLDTAHRDRTLSGLLTEVLLGGSGRPVALGETVTLPCTPDHPRRSAHARLIGSPDHAPVPDAWLATAWPAVFAVLGADELVGSLLDLVHLEHDLVLRREGEPRTVAARVVALSDHEAGTRVDMLAEISDASGVMVEVRGAFLLRGRRGLTARVPESLRRDADEPLRPRASVQERPPFTYGRAQVRAPRSMAAFAAVSGDHNPIHRSASIAKLVGLDGPIVHGAWTSAVAQRVAAELVGAGQPGRLVDWSAQFLAPVLPGEEVDVTVTRAGVAEARAALDVVASVRRDDLVVPVLRARCEVRGPRTAYLFPGQGIQRPGMGMDGYERSAAAREIWDRADAHTRRALGFSILTVVRDNPTVLRVGVPDGSAEIHRHPAGVLHLTQFTQVAMAALAMAQVAELRDEGVFDEEAVCAGHSVGEYNALASIGDVLPLEVVVELVFRRGQSMHHLVPRDAAGNSDYRLGVVRPHQIGMQHAAVEQLVSDLRDRIGETLEIVNYNLRGKQYAVAGTLRSLDALERELESRRRPDSREPFLYVPGIDVPFHSSALRDGVADFRGHLDAGLPERIDPDLLVGRYVPNLVPRPFSLDRSYVEEVRDHVDSAVLAELLADWDRHAGDPGRLCRQLLVELLAWQFASPVRWIETQDLLFAAVADGGLGVERVVEIGLGSQPTVANLARGTLALDDAPARDVVVLNVEADRAVVMALDEDPIVEPADEPAAAPDGEAAPAPAAPAAAAPAAMPAVTDVTAGAPADAPVTPGEALRLLLAVLCKVRPEQIEGAESIDDLVDGVSSRRNQLLMDLGAEFSVSGVDGARELPVDLLAAEIAGRAGRYAFPGPVLRDARDAALTPVLAPRRLKTRDVVTRVGDHWNLGAGWADRVLCALAFDGTDAPSARGGSLGRLLPLPDDGAAAIDAAVRLVSADLGVAVPEPGAAAGGGTVDAAAVADLEARIAGPTGLLADVARGVLDRVDPRLESVDPVDTTTADRLEQLEVEHGDRRAAAVAARFDARRHVAFRSWWGTARHDVVALHHAALDGADPAELEAEAARLARHAVDPGVRASSTWYRRRALERGDSVAAGCFERVLSGTAWTVPLPARAPGLTDGGEAVEAEASSDRIAGLLADIAARPDPWAPAWAVALGSLAGDGEDRPDLSAEVALVTGASPGSIAVELVRQLLAGGATVVCTTTSDTPERLDFYRELYRTAAAPGAELHVVPANLASFSDVDSLVDWILQPVVESAGGVTRTLKDPMVPTIVAPFAAGPVVGELPDAGPSSEVAMRVLLWGVERLVGRLATQLEQIGTAGRRTRVVLPLSPNHGGFGGDGAYGEAKAALEVLTEKWASEHRRWGEHVELVAATIGWVRGTGLMDANDAIAALVERELGVRTFSTAEMGWLLTGLCVPAVARAAGGAPLRADLSGGLGRVEHLHDALAPLAETLESMRSDRDDAVSADDAEDGRIPALLSPPDLQVGSDPSTTVRTSDAATVTPRRPLADMVVVVGAGEVGPWGGSATRFDLELDGELAPGSIAELAWTCGLIRWDAGPDGGSWVDVESDEPLAEGEIAERYRDQVMHRCGIRPFDPDGPLDPDGLSFMVEVFLEHDLVVPASDESDARAFAAADPEHSTVRVGPDGDWQVVRRAGASVRVPRQARLSRRVGGQVPTGFDPTRWGIPAEMAASVDRLALWNLVATVEAFIDAGIEPEELMARVHPARVGNTQGSGMGGMSSIQTLYRDTVLGDGHANDLLQEGLGNVIAAYVVQSYVGSYGPMVHPVAACATAAVSIEDAVDKIRAGKADVVVAGGWDDLGLEGVLGFADMSATASTDDMEAAGLVPSRFSRANDRRRGGFVEAQGGGTLLLARGSTALELGLPVRAVVVHAGSYGDGINTSIPAPGLGALACVLGGSSSPLAVALADHGLTADDIAVASKHDTSTAANDPNESELHEQIAGHLGRSEGNPMVVVSQKTVTGHGKGGAAAWQAIGLVQVLESGQVPGNRNLECLDESHRDHTHLAYGHRTIRAGETLRAGLLTSLGFGHVSAVVCLAHAEVFDAALDAAVAPDVAARYRQHAAQRRRDGRRRRERGRLGEDPMYRKRTDRRLGGADGSPERRDAEVALLTEPTARLDEDGTYRVAAVEVGS